MLAALVKETSKLLAQALVGLAAMTEHDRRLEELLLDIVRWVTPTRNDGRSQNWSKPRLAILGAHPIPLQPSGARPALGRFDVAFA